MCFFLNDGVSMLNRMLIKAIVGFSIACASLTTFAASIEGYWKSIDDRTGEQLSIVEIKKKPDNTYTGTIVADILREDIEGSSLGIKPESLSVRNARAKLYNKEGGFKVPGATGRGDNEAYGITRYMDISAFIDYEVQPLTFLGRTLFGDNFSFTKALDRTRVVRRQTRSE